MMPVELKLRSLTLLMLVLLLASSLAYPLDAPVASTATHACTDSERWNFSPAISGNWREMFEKFLSHGKSDVMSFSEGLALRSLSDSSESSAFGEYWISRSLLHSKMIHIAHQGFLSIASRAMESSSAGIQAAALECVAEIQSRFPGLGLGAVAGAKILELNQMKGPGNLKSALVRAAATRFRELLADSASKAELSPFLDILKESPSEEALAQSLSAARNKHHKEAVQWGARFLKHSPMPKHLERFQDPVRLITGRALYSLKRFDESAHIFRLVKRQSNELTESLSELAWAYLQHEQYREAIGTAVNLQVGGLRKTFAPEAPMVMAMAFNELCQFPKAVESVSMFRKNYRASYGWLSEWAKRGDRDPLDLYKVALEYLKSQPVSVPDKIASEWVKSHTFLSHQDEINLFFDENDSALRLGQKGDQEQGKLAVELLDFTRDFKRRYLLARAKLKPGSEIPTSLTHDLDKLRTMTTAYRRFREAAPIWRKILEHHTAMTPSKTARLSQNIREEFSRLNQRMTEQLNEIAENNNFIEVEIFNGASQDIIWKNAYPDYEKIARKIGSEEASNALKTWNWGQVKFDSDHQGEIWEDELGAFKADVFDNCSNKEKYLQIKRQIAMENKKEDQ